MRLVVHYGTRGVARVPLPLKVVLGRLSLDIGCQELGLSLKGGSTPWYSEHRAVESPGQGRSAPALPGVQYCPWPGQEGALLGQ